MHNEYRYGWRVCLILLVGLAGAASSAYSDTGERVLRALTEDPPRDAAFPASVVELSIDAGGHRMPAHLYQAAGPGPHPTVVLLHGLPGNERNLDIAQALRRLGFNTLYFHYRGAWGAEGEYRFTQVAEDALVVLDYLRDQETARTLRVDASALTLLGHSLGGFTALAAGARDPDLGCVISLSPANLGLWKDELEIQGENAQRLIAYADVLFMLEGLTGARLAEELLVAPRTLLDTQGFGPDLVGKAVLMLVGEDDTVTPAATMFDPVVAAYRKIDGLDLTARKLPGDHSFSETRIALTREILGWVDGHCRRASP